MFLCAVWSWHLSENSIQEFFLWGIILLVAVCCQEAFCSVWMSSLPRLQYLRNWDCPPPSLPSSVLDRQQCLPVGQADRSAPWWGRALPFCRVLLKFPTHFRSWEKVLVLTRLLGRGHRFRRGFFSFFFLMNLTGFNIFSKADYIKWPWLGWKPSLECFGRIIGSSFTAS